MALLLSLKTLGGGFVFDDRPIIKARRELDSLGSLPSLLLASYWGSDKHAGLYRPLTLVSLALDAAVWGRESAFGFHLTNALLYAACSAALAWAMLRLGAPRLAALAAGLLFACHPIHTEAVAPIVGRSELGCLLFLLLALAWAPLGAQAARAWRRAGGVALALLLSLGFKETGLAGVPVLALAPLLFERAPVAPGVRPRLALLARMWRVWLALGVALLLWLAARSTALGPDVFGPSAFKTGLLNNPLVTRDAVGRIAGGLAVSLTALRLALWPWPLSADYSYRALVPPSSLLAPAALLGLVLWLAQIGALLAILSRVQRRASPPELRLVGLGIALYAATLLPASNLLRPIGTIFGERLLFAPSAGLCLIAGAAVAAAARRGGGADRAARALVLAALLAGSLAFYTRLSVWQSDLALARSIVAVQPESAKGHHMLGTELFRAAATRSGEERARLLEASEAELRTALAILPLYSEAWGNLSLVVLARGDRAAWVEAVQRHHETAPHDLMAISQLAMVELHLGHPEQALRWSEAGLAKFPGAPEMLRPRAEALYRLGRLEEALAELRTLREVYPDDVAVSRLRIDALIDAGRFEEARRESDRLLAEPRPESPYPALREGIATDYLRRAQLALRQGELEPALRDLRRAVRLDPGLSEAQSLLAEVQRRQDP